MAGKTKLPKTKFYQQVILEQRLKGVSFAKIAVGMGLSPGYVYKLYKQALNSIIVEDVKDLRKREILKLDEAEKLITAILEKEHILVSGGKVVSTYVRDEDGNIELDEDGEPKTQPLEDSGTNLLAVDRLLRLMERRSKLMGLDAPTKVAPTTPDGKKPFPSKTTLDVSQLSDSALQELLDARTTSD